MYPILCVCIIHLGGKGTLPRIDWDPPSHLLLHEFQILQGGGMSAQCPLLTSQCEAVIQPLNTEAASAPAIVCETPVLTHIPYSRKTLRYKFSIHFSKQEN